MDHQITNPLSFLAWSCQLSSHVKQMPSPHDLTERTESTKAHSLEVPHIYAPQSGPAQPPIEQIGSFFLKEIKIGLKQGSSSSLIKPISFSRELNFHIATFSGRFPAHRSRREKESSSFPRDDQFHRFWYALNCTYNSFYYEVIQSLFKKIAVIYESICCVFIDWQIGYSEKKN